MRLAHAGWAVKVKREPLALYNFSGMGKRDPTSTAMAGRWGPGGSRGSGPDAIFPSGDSDRSRQQPGRLESLFWRLLDTDRRQPMNAMQIQKATISRLIPANDQLGRQSAPRQLPLCPARSIRPLSGVSGGLSFDYNNSVTGAVTRNYH